MGPWLRTQGEGGEWEQVWGGHLQTELQSGEPAPERERKVTGKMGKLERKRSSPPGGTDFQDRKLQYLHVPPRGSGKEQ